MHLPPIMVRQGVEFDYFKPSASLRCNFNGARTLEGAREKEEDEDSKAKGERDA